MRRLPWALLVVAASAIDATAQTRAARSVTSTAPGTLVRGFADVGWTAFRARRSFEATLGTAANTVFGVGGEVVLPRSIVVGARFSHFSAEGERVFVFEGQTFGLGIPVTVRVRPIEVSAGYRFRIPASRVVPYAGGGVGWHTYEEASEFATTEENVTETFTGYHLLGGAEFRVSRLFSLAGEAQWTTVPNALGQHPDSVSSVFSETDLGGTAFRVKLIVGRR